MNKIISNLLIVLFFTSCKGQNENSFLDKFHPIVSIPKNQNECYINFDSLNRIDYFSLNKFLINVNDFETSLINTKHRYFYGSKYTLNDSLYLVTIVKQYETIGQYKNVISNCYDILFFTYNIKSQKLLSSIILVQSNPILRTFTYKEDGSFIVKSKSFYFNSSDTEKNECQIINVENEFIYKIINGIFQKI